jgi:hypothetical protein
VGSEDDLHAFGGSVGVQLTRTAHVVPHQRGLPVKWAISIEAAEAESLSERDDPRTIAARPIVAAGDGLEQLRDTRSP